MEIVLENVSKIYNRHLASEVVALSDVNLVIRAGEVVCLQGSSGSGKSTLLSIIGAIFTPTVGNATIGGRKVSRLPEHFLTQFRQENIGFVPQSFNLFSYMTVLENICVPLLPLGLSPKVRREKALHLMRSLHIEHREKFPVCQISGGEVQRTAIARALIHSPAIILADEPTAHLDATLSEEFMDIVMTLQQAGKTVIIASHDPLVVEHHSINKVFAIRQGRVSQKACCEELCS